MQQLHVFVAWHMSRGSLSCSNGRWSLGNRRGYIPDIYDRRTVMGMSSHNICRPITCILRAQHLLQYSIVLFYCRHLRNNAILLNSNPITTSKQQQHSNLKNKSINTKCRRMVRGMGPIIYNHPLPHPNVTIFVKDAIKHDRLFKYPSRSQYLSWEYHIYIFLFDILWEIDFLKVQKNTRVDCIQ